jgi:hypothetical protein
LPNITSSSRAPSPKISINFRLPIHNDNGSNMLIWTWTWTWLMLSTAAAAANLNSIRHEAESSHVSWIPPATTTLPFRPTIEVSSSETLHITTFPEIPHTPKAIATATEPPQKETETVEAQSRAEPDASLEITFLVLGALLALASVFVAIFFGYKQLSFMRHQSSIERSGVRDSGSGVNLEMGPVVAPGDATDGAGAAIVPI